MFLLTICVFHLVWAAVTGAFSAAERSYPMSEVRGRSQEDPMPQGRRPRGVTPHPRSGAAAKSARLQRRRKAQKKLPHGLSSGAVAGRSNPTSKERWLRSAGGPRGAIPRSRSGGAAVRRYPLSKVRSSGCALLEQP